eukprot:PhF_6_TR10979/c0_g1_i1/m.17740
MWKVLRRMQGETYDEPTTRGMERVTENLRTIATHECKPHPKEIPATTFTEAYGDIVYSKIVRTMKESTDVGLRVKSLTMLVSLLELKKDNVVKALRASVVEALVAALDDPEDDVRALSCVCLEICSEHPEGMERVRGLKVLPRFLKVIDDDDARVVIGILRVLAALNRSRDTSLTEELIQLGCIKIYLSKIEIAIEHDGVVAAALHALHQVVQVKEAFVTILEANAMEVFKKVIDPKRSREVETWCVALENITSVAFFTAGKRAAVACGILKTLNEILTIVSVLEQESDMQLALACTGAIIAIAIDDEGKKHTFEMGIVQVVLAMIENPTSLTDSGLVVNLIEVLCIVSESPVARQTMQPCLGRLQYIAQLSEGKELRVHKAATRCIALVKWVPGDPR